MSRSKPFTAEKARAVELEDPAAGVEDEQFFVRMFKHDFKDPPWRRPGGRLPTGFVLSSERWGDGDDGLGRTLLRDFLQSLVEAKAHPAWLFLVNTAVRLGLEGGESLHYLQKLESLGVKILVSKTSLYHFESESLLRVGEVVTMLEVVTIIHRADKVVTLG